MPNWECLVLKQGETSFTLRGEGLLYHGQVWQGRMGQDVYWGLKALEHPQAAQRLLRPHRLYVPREHLSRSNMGKDRRVVHLLTEGMAPVILKFQETIEPDFLSALKQAFSPATGVDRNSKGESHAEVDSGTEHGTADPARDGGQGDGHDHDRQPAQGRRRARVRAGQKVASRPKRKLKAKARKSRG